MRIVGGKWRGRSLRPPEDASVRPTSDRLREAIFNVLAHAYDDASAGAHVLDLFAGTGALAFEALSRGAAFAVMVDHGAQARGLIRDNVETLGCGGVTRLFRRDATRMGAVGANPPFDLVFCDPPYGQDLAPAALRSCAQGRWLAPGALCVVEEAGAAAVALPESFALLEQRTYGETQVLFARYGTA